MGCHQQVEHHTDSHTFDTNQLRSGMLICRLGNGFFSNQFRQRASKEQKYSHIGFLSCERDTLFVYHTEASELTGVGHVLRQPLDEFLEGIEVFDFFQLQLPDEVVDQMVSWGQTYYQRRTPFDMAFDAANDDKLYCTEFVATCLNRSLPDSIAMVQPTLELGGRRFYGLDDLYQQTYVRKLSLF